MSTFIRLSTLLCAGTALALLTVGCSQDMSIKGAGGGDQAVSSANGSGDGSDIEVGGEPGGSTTGGTTSGGTTSGGTTSGGTTSGGTTSGGATGGSPSGGEPGSTTGGATGGTSGGATGGTTAGNPPAAGNDCAGAAEAVCPNVKSMALEIARDGGNNDVVFNENAGLVNILPASQDLKVVLGSFKIPAGSEIRSIKLNTLADKLGVVRHNGEKYCDLRVPSNVVRFNATPSVSVGKDEKYRLYLEMPSDVVIERGGNGVCNLRHVMKLRIERE